MAETKQFEKITDEELAELRQKHENLFKNLDAIANAWLTQQRCIEDLNTMRTLHPQRAKDYNDFQQSIIDKYGNVNVDLKTGTLTYL